MYGPNPRSYKKALAQAASRIFMLAGLFLYLGATARDVELEKISAEQKLNLTALEASLAAMRPRLKKEITQAKEIQKITSERLANNISFIEKAQQKVQGLQEELERVSDQPSPRSDQITFANGASFVGEALRYKDKQITIRSASGEQKTGPLSIIKSISFHRLKLEMEEFPEAPKRAAAVQRTNHAEVMARFNPNVLKVQVSRGTQDRSGNYYTDTSEGVSISINVSYKNPHHKLEGVTLEAFTLGRNLQNKKLGRLISKQRFKVAPLGPSTQEFQTKETRISYYKSRYSRYKSGFDYYAYLVVLKDRDGKIIFTKGSRSSVEDLYDDIKNLSASDQFSY